ncbi:MAG: carboxypeptidase-like regulatory domain-containing protein, partial [Saccharofermentanales bacterium]
SSVSSSASESSLASEAPSADTSVISTNAVLSRIEVVSGIDKGTVDKQPTSQDDKTVSITGKLLDYLGKPISGMKILLYNTGKISTTGHDGSYRFNDVKVGNYKIFIINNIGNEIAELPIVISFGEHTLVSDGSVQVKGGTLQMDLSLSGEILLIKAVSSPKYVFTKEVIVYVIMVAMVLAAVTLFVIFKKDRNRTDINMD